MSDEWDVASTRAMFEVPDHAPEGSQWAARRRMAAALRELVSHVAPSSSPDETLDRAAQMIETLNAKFRLQSRLTIREGMISGDVRAKPSYFADQNPVIGLSNPIAPPVRLSWDGDLVVGKVTFGAAYEGPPGGVHGGYIAAVLDQVIGHTMVGQGIAGLTAELKVRYRRLTPLESPLVIEAKFEERHGTRIRSTGRVLADGEVTAEGECTFVTLKASQMQTMFMGGKDAD